MLQSRIIGRVTTNIFTRSCMFPCFTHQSVIDKIKPQYERTYDIYSKMVYKPKFPKYISDSNLRIPQLKYYQENLCGMRGHMAEHLMYNQLPRGRFAHQVLKVMQEHFEDRYHDINEFIKKNDTIISHMREMIDTKDRNNDEMRFVLMRMNCIESLRDIKPEDREFWLVDDDIRVDK